MTERRRLVPLPEAEWDSKLGPFQERLEPVLNVHRVLANHPDLLRAWAPLRQHIAFGGSLPPRLREIVILRVAHRTDSDYEWHQHVERGKAAGLGDREIDAVRREDAADWTPEEAVLLAATDQLLDGAVVAAATWDELVDTFTVDQVLDFIVTVGVYRTVSMLIASAGVELES